MRRGFAQFCEATGDSEGALALPVHAADCGAICASLVIAKSLEQAGDIAMADS